MSMSRSRPTSSRPSPAPRNRPEREAIWAEAVKALAQFRCLSVAHRTADPGCGARSGEGLTPGDREFFCWQGRRAKVPGLLWQLQAVPPPLARHAIPRRHGPPIRSAGPCRSTFAGPTGRNGDRLFIGRCRDYRTPWRRHGQVLTKPNSAPIWRKTRPSPRSRPPLPPPRSSSWSACAAAITCACSSRKPCPN